MTSPGAQHYVSMVQFSDDAIISKDLDGVILTWNPGAERLFGYAAGEAVGKHISLIIPPPRLAEEFAILDRIQRGQPVTHFETVRQRKDGSLVDISLTVSPIKDASGKVIGASKVAREITERRRAEEQQNLLLREMDHRVKNAFAIADSILTLTARTAKTPRELANSVSERLQSLARAHALTLPDAAGDTEHATTLHALVRTIVAPYDAPEESQSRVTITGPDLPITGRVITNFALLLHEFATNAAKYGSLSVADGQLHIECVDEGEQFVISWKELGGPPVIASEGDGFGSVLVRVTVAGQFGGTISRDWKPDGLTIRISIPRDRITG